MDGKYMSSKPLNNFVKFKNGDVVLKMSPDYQRSD